MRYKEIIWHENYMFCFIIIVTYLPDITNHTINIKDNVRNNLSEVIFDDSKITLRTKIFKKYSLYFFLSQYDGLCFILLRFFSTVTHMKAASRYWGHVQYKSRLSS